jgi:hypothetical protein
MKAGNADLRTERFLRRAADSRCRKTAAQDQSGAATANCFPVAGLDDDGGLSATGSFPNGTPTPLFKVSTPPIGTSGRQCAVTKDRRQFLINVVQGSQRPPR